MTTSKEVLVLDNGACTAKVGVSNSEHPRYVL
jgi:actin-related protein